MPAVTANAELRGASPLAGAASLSNDVLERTVNKEIDMKRYTDKEVVQWLSPGAECVTGDDGKFWIRGGGFIIAKGATEEEAWANARAL
jgi:hypothetical protein